MQDYFSGGRGRLRGQEAEPSPEPYELYRRDEIPLTDVQRIARDFEYFKSMYPSGARMLQQYVEEVCDEMEYEGSPIYDEYPDRVLMEQMIQKIRAKAADWLAQENQETRMQPGTPAQGNEKWQEEERPEEVRSEKMQPEERRPEETVDNSAEEARTQELKTYRGASRVRVSYGPVYGECQRKPEGYQIWETAPVRIQETEGFRSQRPPRPPQDPWGPPSPGPWGPSRPPQGPWGPPSPGPWGPSRPPQGPWGPPPPRPWGPPSPPPGRPGNQNFFGDLLSVLLFNELQGRRCRFGNCR